MPGGGLVTGQQMIGGEVAQGRLISEFDRFRECLAAPRDIFPLIPQSTEQRMPFGQVGMVDEEAADTGDAVVHTFVQVVSRGVVVTAAGLVPALSHMVHQNGFEVVVELQVRQQLEVRGGGNELRVLHVRRELGVPLPQYLEMSHGEMGHGQLDARRSDARRLGGGYQPQRRRSGGRPLRRCARWGRYPGRRRFRRYRRARCRHRRCGGRGR